MRKPLNCYTQCKSNSANISPSPNVLLCTSLGTFTIRDLREGERKRIQWGEEGGFKAPVKGKTMAITPWRSLRGTTGCSGPTQRCLPSLGQTSISSTEHHRTFSWKQSPCHTKSTYLQPAQTLTQWDTREGDQLRDHRFSSASSSFLGNTLERKGWP